MMETECKPRHVNGRSTIFTMTTCCGLSSLSSPFPQERVGLCKYTSDVCPEGLLCYQRSWLWHACSRIVCIVLTCIPVTHPYTLQCSIHIITQRFVCSTYPEGSSLVGHMWGKCIMYITSGPNITTSENASVFNSCPIFFIDNNLCSNSNR